MGWVFRLLGLAVVVAALIAVAVLVQTGFLIPVELLLDRLHIHIRLCSQERFPRLLVVPGELLGRVGAIREMSDVCLCNMLVVLGRRVCHLMYRHRSRSRGGFVVSRPLEMWLL